MCQVCQFGQQAQSLLHGIAFVLASFLEYLGELNLDLLASDDVK